MSQEDCRGSRRRTSRERRSLPNAGSMRLQATTIISNLVLLALASLCEGQIGDLCACTPSVYEWVLDFSSTCVDNTLGSVGIAETNCDIGGFQPGVTDLTPVQALIIDITEFNQMNQAMQQTILDGEFEDGASFTHVSSTATPGNVTAETVPKALQITIVALNALAQPLSMVWIISFTNSCDQYPVFSQGDQLAWTVFVSTAIGHGPKRRKCTAMIHASHL